MSEDALQRLGPEIQQAFVSPIEDPIEYKDKFPEDLPTLADVKAELGVVVWCKYEACQHNKRIQDKVKTKAMEHFLEGKPAKDIADLVTKQFNVVVKPSTIYAWANQFKWGETRAVSRANAVEQVKETETQRFSRLQEEHLSTYENLRRKASSELNVQTFDRAFDAAKALDLGIKGERQVMEGLISLQFIQDVMGVLVDEVKDADTLNRIALKLKTLVETDND